MAIELKTEKVKTVNGIGRKIIDYKLKEKIDLPDKYLYGKSKAYLDNYCGKKYLKIFDDRLNQVTFCIGNIFTEKDVQVLIEILKECSKNLRIIMNEIREKQEGWEGEETFFI